MTSLGYSTYALPSVDPFDALPKIRDMGYDAIEIAVADDWPTAPHRFDLDEARKLAELSRSLGFPSPVIFGMIDVCALDDPSVMEKTVAKLQMASELHYDDTPILITTIAGHSAPPWEQGRDQIKDSFLRLADLASEYGATIAIEAHAGTDFETPEKAVWIMEQTNHPNLRLDLDISHFYVEGAEVQHSVDLCAPYSAMVHIKDGTKENGKVKYCLPGEGTIDIPLFLRALEQNGLGQLPVFAEVSAQIYRREGYEPWSTAQFCFEALTKAIQEM